MTDDAIIRCSRSYGPLQDLMDIFDKETGHKKQSGNHTVPDCSKDVTELAHMFENEQLFDNICGRSYQNFPGIPENYASKLDMTKVHTWAKSRLEDFKKMSLYSHASMTINQ